MLLNIFSKEDLNTIHQSTLRIFASTGFIADSDEALELFQKAGASVDFKKRLVKLPAFIVEEAIQSAPSTIFLAGRGDKGFYLGDGKTRFCSFGEAPNIIDPETKKIRTVSINDEANYAKLIDALDQQDMCWDSWVASDVPAASYTLHSFNAYVNNTVKPICVATPNGALAEATVKIAQAVCGGEEEARKKPVCIAGTCPKSPLNLDEGICESIIVLAKAGIPNMNMSALTSGGTGPVTLAGTIVIHNAEMLACIVLAQLAAKGAPSVYGACTSALDLRRATATYGCPEIGMFSAAISELAQYYQIPHVVAGFWTDSKISDQQCGHEKTLNGLLPALSGADMIFGTGCLASGMIGSFGQLVADNEMIGMVHRILKGVPVNDGELALDLIEAVGPKGNFLAEQHTIDHMQESQIHPELTDRNTYESWVANGSKSFADKAEEKAIALLKQHKPKPLSVDIQKVIKEIIIETERKLKNR